MALLGRLGPIGGGRLRGGILSAARPLPAEYSEWRQGVAFNSVCIDTNPKVQRVCIPTSESTLEQEAEDKISNPVDDVLEFLPFGVYSMSECSTWLPPDYLSNLTNIGYDRLLSKNVALQLQKDVGVTGNPTLNSVAIDITGAAAQDIVNTVSALEDAAICECGLTELVFHAPLRSKVFFIERDIVEWDSEAGVWMLGNYPIVFDCYGGTGPGDVEVAEDGSEVWLYVTGPIELALGPKEEVLRPDGIIVRTNEASSLHEGLAILRFDTCCVFAARAVIF